MGDWNIVREYDWTSVPKDSQYRKDAPRAMIRSFKINSNEALNRLTSYVEIAKKKSSDAFYNSLYGKATTPEDTFTVPYFNDNIRSFGNNWGDTFQAGFLGTIDSAMLGIANMAGAYDAMDPLKNAGTVMKNAADLAAGIASGEKGFGDLGDLGKGMSSQPGSYIETPKMYQYEQNDSALDISFVLANTINSGAYKQNHKLINHLTVINRPKRINSIEMEPPRIYRIKINKHRNITWAYCSQFSVNFLGAKKMIDEMIVPEGFMVNMSFTSLTTEVSNFIESKN